MNRPNNAIATKTISVFLAFILITGTISAIFPSSLSFMTEVHALSDYRLTMDDYNSKSLPYKKDDIKCNNFNLNANGLNVNTIPEPLSSLLQTQAETEEADISTGTLGNGSTI